MSWLKDLQRLDLCYPNRKRLAEDLNVTTTWVARVLNKVRKPDAEKKKKIRNLVARIKEENKLGGDAMTYSLQLIEKLNACDNIHEVEEVLSRAKPVIEKKANRLLEIQNSNGTE